MFSIRSKRTGILLCFMISFWVLTLYALNVLGPWVPDLGDGTYKNPVIHADYSDPDVERVGSDYYMTSSSFNCTPGLQILHSNDLVNWKIIGKVFDQQIPLTNFSTPKPLEGVWAPSIRYHKGMFYVTYGDPDYGIYMAHAEKPEGPWTLKLIKSGKGLIDPCPFWDDDGQGYLVHAYAGSRAGFNSVLAIRKLSADNSSLSDEIFRFDGNKIDKVLFFVIEGPKMHKRNSYYYIFAPSGGVTQGWQVVLRSKSITGPWEYKKVLEQGNTDINGPHQGAWVTTPDEKESWFFHFQEKNAYGRVVHMQPVVWKDDWPIVGDNGKPVLKWTKPNVGKTYPIVTPQTSDDFSSPDLGLQWQWYANSKPEWFSLSANKGNLRLFSVPLPASDGNYSKVPSLLLQKFPADSFSFTTKVTASLDGNDERAGVIVMGSEHSILAMVKKSDGLYLTRSTSSGSGDIKIAGTTVYLRIGVARPNAECTFEYSLDGTKFTKLGSSFTTSRPKWIGAKIGIFATSPNKASSSGYADFDWVNVSGFGDYSIDETTNAKNEKHKVTSPRINMGGIIGHIPAATSSITISLFTLNGKRVKEIRHTGLFDQDMINITTNAISSGIYIYEIKTNLGLLQKGVFSLNSQIKH